mmetsp:Transcript_47041/g.124652  ORF Transcript_47041/g.124652 Transcript_47041/m.124652 type:complete len:259 (+) Transcript_47041:269-1045(+)
MGPRFRPWGLTSSTTLCAPAKTWSVSSRIASINASSSSNFPLLAGTVAAGLIPMPMTTSPMLCSGLRISSSPLESSSAPPSSSSASNSFMIMSCCACRREDSMGITLSCPTCLLSKTATLIARFLIFSSGHCSPARKKGPTSSTSHPSISWQSNNLSRHVSAPSRSRFTARPVRSGLMRPGAATAPLESCIGALESADGSVIRPCSRSPFNTMPNPQLGSAAQKTTREQADSCNLALESPSRRMTKVRRIVMAALSSC